jgi:hypothetical protein
MTESQVEFIEAVRSEQYLYMVYGGSIRGGKTVVGLWTLILLCKVFPGSRWAVVRRDGPSLTRNTIPSFNRIRPSNFISAPVGKNIEARCTNGSSIIFFGENFSEDKDYERWKGLEVNGFLLDECNELQETTFAKAQERAGTWKLKKGKQPKPYIILTCNPARNWVMTRFYLPWKNGTLKPPFYFRQALTDDNPHLDPIYLEALRNLPPEQYNRFVRGDWDVMDDPRQLITFASLINATNVQPIVGKREMGVDVARFGDDFSAIAEGEGNALVSLERIHGLSTVQLGERVIARMNETATNAEDVRIDVVGLGAGTVDHCKAQGYGVSEFSGGSSAPYDPELEHYKFKNLRSWAWFKFREALRKGEVCIDIEDTSRLFQDLAAPMYWIKADKTVEVESKDQLKKRLGRSPDEGDAVVMWWARNPHTKGSIDLGKKASGRSANKFG